MQLQSSHPLCVVSHQSSCRFDFGHTYLHELEWNLLLPSRWCAFSSIEAASKMVQLCRYLDFDGYAWECLLCDSYFGSLKSLLAHCRHTSRHPWCERCQRVFPFEGAKTAHINNSAAHNICFRCNRRPDFPSFDELMEHRKFKHHWCSYCDIYWSSSQELRWHNVKHHHLCVECDESFSNENNLRMVCPLSKRKETAH